LAAGDRLGQLEDAVGQRRLAVVDVGDDREVADALLLHGLWSVAALEPHQAVRQAVLLDVADVSETGLLEGPPGAAVRLLDGRDDGGRVGAREDDLARELLEHLRAEAAARELLLTDEQIDSGHAVAHLDDLVPLRVVRRQVGLDHPGRAPVHHDQVVLVGLAPVDRGGEVAQALLDRVAPPAADVLAAEPLAEQRQVLVAERLELDHAARRRSERRAWSSRTPNTRHASAYASVAATSATRSETICAASPRPSASSSPRQTP